MLGLGRLPPCPACKRASPVLASCRPTVANPSVNQPYTSARYRPARLDAHLCLHQLVGCSAAEDSPGSCQMLEAGGQMADGIEKHFGCLTLRHPLSGELAIAFTLLRPREALPALLASRIAPLRVFG